jgi:hypothetical protein
MPLDLDKQEVASKLKQVALQKAKLNKHFLGTHTGYEVDFNREIKPEHYKKASKATRDNIRK